MELLFFIVAVPVLALLCFTYIVAIVQKIKNKRELKREREESKQRIQAFSTLKDKLMKEQGMSYQDAWLEADRQVYGSK